MKSCMYGFAICAMSIAIAADSVGQEKGKPRTQNASGVVSKIDGTSLTITQSGGDKGGERSTVFAIGAQTKIILQTNDDDIVKGEGGKERKVPKTKEGKIADVKVDQRVTVGFVEMGKADSVLVLRATPPRKKEGQK